MEAFETVKKEAWSLPPGTLPSGVDLIYVEETRYGTFKYYLEKETGKYFYQSEETEKFNKELMEKVKEKKRCLRESKNYSKQSA